MKSKTTKRPIRILAALCVLCAAGAVALGFVVRSAWFMEQARAQLERGVGRKVAFASLDPSFLRGIGVRARDFCLYEEDGATPCLKAEEILLRVRILPLLWRNLSVSTVTVDQPRASLVRARDGTWNVESLLGREKPAAAGKPEAGPPKKARKTQVTISTLRIRSGIVTVLDESTGRGAVVRDLNLSLSRIAQGGLPYIDGGGRLSGIPLADILKGVREIRPLRVQGGLVAGSFRVKGWAGEMLQFRADLQASGVRYEYPGICRSPAAGADLDLSAQVEGAVRDGAWRLARVTASCFNGRLKMDGSFGNAEGGGLTTLEFTGKALPWKALGRSAVKGLVLEGETTFSSSVRGGGAEIAADLSGSRVAYGAVLDKAPGAVASLKLPLSFAKGSVAWERATARLGSMELSSDGSLETGGGRALKAKLRSNVFDLREAGRSLAAVTGMAGKGEIDLHISHSLNTPFSAAEISGTVKISGGEFTAASLPRPLRVDAVTTCAPGSVRVGLNTVRMGSSLAEGYVSFDLKRWPSCEYDFNFPLIDTADFSAAPPPAHAASRASFSLVQSAEAAPPPQARPVFRIPEFLKRMEGNGRVSVGELRLGKLRSRNGRARLRLSKGIASLDEVVLPLYDGEFGGKVAADIRGDSPRYSIESTLARVDLDALLADIYGYSRRLSGRLSAECAASGDGAGWDEVRKALKAKGRFSVEGGVLHSGNLLKGMGPVMFMLGRQAKCKEFTAMGELLGKAPSEMRLSRCAGTFLFDGDEWGTGDMLLETADPKSPMRLQIEGEMGLDGALHFFGYASFPRGSAYYAQLAPYFPDDGGWIELPFPIPIGGTLENPRVDADASSESVAKCAAGIGTARMRKEIEKKIDRVLAPQPKKTGSGAKAPQGIEDVGRELLKGGSKEILKQMLKK
ncbi:MAG: AsmA family protein [Chlamydiota bacterium]